MDTTIIDKGNINLFKDLLIPEEASLILAGKPLFALGLVDNGVACGAVAGGPYESVFKVSSLFVAPDYRKMGGASLLLKTLENLMLGIKGLYEIQVDFTIFNEEHKLLEKFLLNTGFSFERGADGIYSVSLGSLANNPFYSNTASNVDVRRFSTLPVSCIRELDQKMRVSDGAPLSVPLESAQLEADLSVAVMNANHIDGFILFDHSFSGMLTLAYADSGSGAGSSAFSAMLKTSYQNALRKYSSDTKIIIQTVNSLSEALIEKLANNRELISRSAHLRISE